jgi:DNA-binding transcriptional ArsR family regulator
VGKRGKILEERGLVDRERDGEYRRIYQITTDAETTYFGQESREELNVDSAPNELDEPEDSDEGPLVESPSQTPT